MNGGVYILPIICLARRIRPLKPGEWQLGAGGKTPLRLSVGTKVGKLVMGQYGLSAVPIAFREVLYDLHLRKNQRFFCLGATLLLCILVLVLFLFLLICFNRVIKKLEVEQNEINQGLRMVPDFDSRSGNGIVSLARDKVAKARYVESIQEYLEGPFTLRIERFDGMYNGQPSHAWCRFPLEVFDAAGCTALNRYGFDNGEPCFLFELKLYDQITMRKNAGVKVISALGDRSMAGFPVNKIPSRTISDSKGRDVSDENGETLYDQPALVSEREMCEATISFTCNFL
ncbi:unnamed protein product [Heligmosomoides polygyrus]|uniref:Amiloride-sensitive sodium channel n=1 Tax=Heligmosomoides polygyrus TaxID=6339 RepID=A0A3P8C5W2_HELPZ|nr:unnamed protein product [Heligmosomoides polygyrus]